MKKIYLEHRSLTTLAIRPSNDIARHLQARQYLGSAVIITDNPLATLSATRKQWLRAGRYLQRQRASTLNAEEILRYTKAIMNVQNMHFTLESPLKSPDATVFFSKPAATPELPPDCLTLYVTAPWTVGKEVTQGLSDGALIVSYNENVQNAEVFHTKAQLEEVVLKKWRALQRILRHHDIDTSHLSLQPADIHNLDAALDNLIGDSSEFLAKALDFQRALDLAQPLATISLETQRTFEAISRLAYRVHTLTPTSMIERSSHLLRDSDNYFLRESGIGYGNDPLFALLDCSVHLPYVPKPATIKP